MKNNFILWLLVRKRGFSQKAVLISLFVGCGNIAVGAEVPGWSKKIELIKVCQYFYNYGGWGKT